MHKILNWHPWGDNPLDYMNGSSPDLRLPNGNVVTLFRMTTGQCLYTEWDGERAVASATLPSIPALCSMLNRLKVGIVE